MTRLALWACGGVFTILLSLNAQSAAQQSADTSRDAAALVAQLHDQQKGPAAADQLVRVDPEIAVPALTEALSEDHALEVRWRAARALGRIGPAAADAAGSLIAVLDDPAPEVRAYAAFALGRIGGEAAQGAVPTLVKQLTDENSTVRRAALDALFALRPDPQVVTPLLVQALEDADPRIAVASLRTLADRGESAVPLLVKSLESPKAAYWAALALEELGPKAKTAVPALTKLLSHEEPEVRMQALLALGAVGNDAQPAAKHVIALLQNDPMTGVRYAAAFALGKIGGGPQGDAALQAASQHEDPLLAMLAAWALAKSHPDDPQIAERASKLIVAGLQSENPNVQAAAAKALAESDLGSEVTAEALVDALEEAPPHVATDAVHALALLGPKAVPHVVRGLKNENLRMYAVRVLKRIGPDAAEAVPALTAVLESTDDPAVRREVQFALAAIGPAAEAAAPELVNSLSAENDQVKYSAIYALGSMGEQGRAGYNELLNNLNSEDTFLQIASIWAMARIDPGQPAVAEIGVPILIESLQSDREVIRVEAASTLGELGAYAKAALPALKQALNDKSQRVQEAAKKAIARMEAP
ncbi:MAG: HEAT repeat domain-containing protein [Planctomycetes bacterium]|nr:HEAT repeat domain-containing protein [Planctomycetota bacterium]